MSNVKPTTKYASKRMQRWRWLMEEFGPTFKYLKGKANNLADALSRLDTGKEVAQTLCLLEAEDVTFCHLDDAAQAEMYDAAADDDIPVHIYPLSAHVIAQEQRQDSELLRLLTSDPAYFTRKVKNAELIHMHGKIYIPARLCTHLLTWYHEMLCHPGQTRLENTIRQHFTWPKLSTDVKNICSDCHACKIYKNFKTKYGLLPPKKH